MLRSLARWPVGWLVHRLATATILVPVSAGCSRDHSALEADDGGSGGLGGGTPSSTAGFPVGQGAGGGGGASQASGSIGSGAGDPGSGPGSGGGGPDLPDEPDGPPRLVFVHGAPDRERVAVCLAAATGDGLDVPPSPPGGLPYATGVVVEPGVVPIEGDVLVVLVAGAAEDLDEARCEALLSDPEASPELERVPIGSLPRSAIDAPRVLVMVAAGCLGGEGQESDVAEAVCGAGYEALSPTAALVVGTPSRLITDGRVGLQAIGASLPTAPFDVFVGHDDGELPRRVAEALSLGATLPFPPDASRDEVDLAPASQLVASAILPDEDVALAAVDLGAAMARAGVQAFEDGETYALVFVGPTASLGEGAWWRGFDVAVVPTR